jgi:Flp pilus assembly protein TadD
MMKISNAQYEALCRLGHRLFDRGKTTRAARIFRGLTTIMPEYGYAWRLLGACRSRLGDARGSASAFERALEVDSEDVEARVAYAELLADHQRIKDAVSLIEPVIRQPASDDESHQRRRARALWRRWKGS